MKAKARETRVILNVSMTTVEAEILKAILTEGAKINFNWARREIADEIIRALSGGPHES